MNFRSDPTRAQAGLVAASIVDTARVLGIALAPIVAQGVIARRRRVVALAGKLDTDGRGVRVLQEIRDRYGAGPVRLPIPLRPVALVFDPTDVRTVLTGTPGPFTPRNREKRGALGRFQPHGVLVSRNAERTPRRRVAETVLDGGHPVHRHADALVRVVREEATALVAAARGRGGFGWDEFITAWWCVVRRTVLGDPARDDHLLTDDLTVLRHAANWSGFGRRHRRRAARLRTRLEAYVAAAAPGSLAALVAEQPDSHGADPVGQIPQWLFAFDPAGAVALRALALLVAHPEELAAVRAELAGRELEALQELPRLRAAVLESARLWPTTPLLLRDSTRSTGWRGGDLPAHTAMVVPAWFLHRDPDRPDADRFDPQKWLDGSADTDWSLVPFSAGPGACPGRELVLLVASTFLATLLDHAELTGEAGVPDSTEPLPRGLDPFGVRVGVGPPTVGASAAAEPDSTPACG